MQTDHDHDNHEITPGIVPKLALFFNVAHCESAYNMITGSKRWPSTMHFGMILHNFKFYRKFARVTRIGGHICDHHCRTI